ncbi:MAG: hypothetical protein RL065_1256, partial [Bacteroidota bacterium]
VLTYTGNAASIIGATALWTLPIGATIVSGSLNSFGTIKAILAKGMNQISLTVTNSICTSTTNDSVRIYQIPTSIFSFNNNPTCENQASTVTYNGNATSSANYNWIFTNGVATPGGTTANQSVTWSTANNSNLVSLVVSENGCTSTLTSQNVSVLQMPTVSITKNNPTCAGDTLILNYSGNGQSIAGATPLWTFTNNPTIVSGNVNAFGTIKLIPKSGKTVVTMSVANGICTTQAKDSVTITPIPTASFSFSNATVCANSNLVFTYNGTAPTSATYNWNFNGGNATPGGTVKGPQTVNWSTAGTKTVSLQVVNNGCSSNVGNATITVVAIPTTSFTINPTQVCSGATAVITYTGSNLATAYNWSATGTHTPSVLSGKGPHNVKWTNTTSAIKTEMVILKVTQSGCTSYPDTNYVSVVPLPIAAFTTNSPICPTDTLHVNFTGSNILPVANFTWSFVGNNGSIGSGVGPYAINYSNSGKYEITLSITQNNCTSNLLSDSITVLPQPFVHIYQDTTICVGNSVTLNATGANTYVWDNGLGTNASIMVSPITTTTYHVVGSNGSCTASDDATVVVANYPVAYAGRDTMIPVNGNIELGTTSTVGYAYSWSPSATLNNASLSNPIAQPLDSTMYIVAVSNASGCIALDSVIILVGRCYNPAIANTFTPNDDGENDNFRILNTHKLKSVEKFEIFNRWGEKIFSSNDIHNTTWDGTYHGVMQEIGTYVYIIQATCLNDEKISLKGTIELIR